ncbi:MAG: nucleotidyltransferase family protein [Clostridiales bacterium]|nr:nucleotidyltransferase family protein [Clostridiales bacterium]
MTDSESIFLTILKEVVHPGDSPIQLPASADWEEVLTVASRQNLFPLIYDACGRYEGFSAFDEENPDYFISAMNSMKEQMHQNQVFLALYEEFLMAGVAPIAVKGIICRQLYGIKGDLRPSGDVDILIEKKDYFTIAEILRQCGYISGDVIDTEMKSIQEVTFFNRQEGLEIEVHLNQFGTNNVTYERMNGWFEDVFQTNVTIDIQGIPVRTMSATDHMLFLIFHAFKHFMQQGFGIRLMLDALLYMEKYQEKIDWEYVRKGMEAVGADRFFFDLIVVGNQYLGFELPESEKRICPDELLEHMLHMGTFGMTQEAAVGAGEFVAAAILKKSIKNRGGGRYQRMHMCCSPRGRHGPPGGRIWKTGHGVCPWNG